MKIYVASSWRNHLQPTVVEHLRGAGYEVYDFRHPRPDDIGFHWSEIDTEWKTWTLPAYVKGLAHEFAKRGFRYDFEAMQWADCGVLVLPCGRSAHLEAGWFIGSGKPLHILLSDVQFEPELMYKAATSVNCSMDELLAALAKEGQYEISQQPA